MSWNYRLVRRRVKFHGISETYYGIHEAFYFSKDKAKVSAITQEPVSVGGESKEAVISALAMMLNDVLRRPILEYNKIGKKPPREKAKKRH